METTTEHGRLTSKFESPDYDALKSSEAIEQAEANGGTVVFPTAKQLQLDVDTTEALETFQSNLPTLEWMLGVDRWDMTPSRSEGKFHVTVHLIRPVTSDMERILLQACLGSDPKRELLSYARVLDRDEHPTLFIEGGEKPVKKELTEVEQ